MRGLIGVCAVVALAGCATMSSEQRDYYARSHIGLHKCGQAGMLNTETVSKGHAWLNTRYYTSDSAQVQNAIREMEPYFPRVTQGYCDQLAGLLLATAELEQRKPAASAPTYAPMPQMPKQTICNQMGSQTFCRTY